jgi:hypothetical protein
MLVRGERTANLSAGQILESRRDSPITVRVEKKWKSGESVANSRDCGRLLRTAVRLSTNARGRHVAVPQLVRAGCFSVDERFGGS